MPSAEKFLSSFGFIKGSQFDGYILTTIISNHITIKRYQEYEYPIELLFSNINNGTWENLFKVLKNIIMDENIIKGVRNPYKCTIDYPVHGDVYKENDNIRIYLTGHAYRVY